MAQVMLLITLNDVGSTQKNLGCKGPRPSLVNLLIQPPAQTDYIERGGGEGGRMKREEGGRRE